MVNQELKLEAVKRLKMLFYESEERFLCRIAETEEDETTINLLFNQSLRNNFLKYYKCGNSLILGQSYLFDIVDFPPLIYRRQVRLDYLDFVIAKLEKETILNNQ